MRRVCVLSRLHTGAWNVRFLWSKEWPKYKGIEIRRSFMRARQWSTDRLVGCSIVSSLSFSLSLFLSFSRWHAFYGTNTLIAHHRNAVEQRKPVRNHKRDAPVQGRHRQSAGLYCVELNCEKHERCVPRKWSRSSVTEACFLNECYFNLKN